MSSTKTRPALASEHLRRAQHAAELSALIYDWPQIERHERLIDCGRIDSVDWCVLRGPSRVQEAWIVFCGSVDDQDWERNRDYTPADTIVGRVHGGFWEGWRLCYPSIVRAIDQDWTLRITGHSQGAALALLAHADLSRLGRRIRTYAFGSPRVWRSPWTRQSWEDHIYRFAAPGDLVCHLPLGLAGFALRWAVQLSLLLAIRAWVPLPWPVASGYRHVGHEYRFGRTLGSLAGTHRITNLWHGMCVAAHKGLTGPHAIEHYQQHLAAFEAPA